MTTSNGVCSHAKNPLFNKVLIANRGEIAVRIARALKKLGIISVAIYSDADQNHKHVRVADIAVRVDAITPADAYLDIKKIIKIAKEYEVDAIIPGYGFLAENADFAMACENNGIVFIGPTPEQIIKFGLKHVAKEMAQKLDIPLNDGSDILKNIELACKAAQKIGYPVMLKCTGGGGGIGLSKCHDENELRSVYESVQRLGQSFFSNSQVFLEKFVENARHIEVQIFGDGLGNVVALGERDCSIQRRNQKIIEETPAPNLPDHVRLGICDAAEKLARFVNYRSAGTVEFLYDEKDEKFYFIEVNARLQVEHCVTEEVLGIDLVEWMIKTAAKCSPDLKQKFEPKGSSIEIRIYAEEPLRNFLPSIGTLTEVRFPENVRVDGYVELGTEVLSSFDPLLAKVIVHGQDRKQALDQLKQALIQTRISGVSTNLEYLLAILDDHRYKSGKISTQLLSNFTFHAPVIEVIEPGTFTTIQDYPGRVGYWDIGLPPSGPMDDWAFRMANRVLENPENSAAIEATIIGPTIKFHTSTWISLTGAPTNAELDGKKVSFWTPILVQPDQTLRIGKIISGCRTYLAVRNGFNIPEYLESKSTFTPGQFGGHAGRALRGSDMLLLNRENERFEPKFIPDTLIPTYGDEWNIGCLLGPHGAPDFIQTESFESFFEKSFEVHYNSNRLGIRLTGPKPDWVRSDGGEAGLHPSNIHDCEYAIGSINFTGDMPVILTCDGPSLGGFVCPLTIVKAELWKVGQLKPGDKIWFKPMGFDDALKLEKLQDKTLEELSHTPKAKLFENFGSRSDKSSIILYEQEEKDGMPKIVYRQAGDKYILIEYGENILDLNLRCRVHEMTEELKQQPINGILELSPGVRSLQIHYDSRVIHQKDLRCSLVKIEQELSDSTKMKIKSRVVYLPMSFEDPATLDAISRYRKSVRDTAPWLPSNIEFMRRINGLNSKEDVKKTIFDASYMVLGLGDVYLGAPCAVPVDPRHRLVTSKYNPARTFTAEGTVGIGGVYMCIYGMDSPGGYQLVGRTLPIWNKFITNKECFEEGAPWLLRFFDQVRFYEVEANELEVMREGFRHGRFKIRIEEEIFDFAKYNKFLKENEKDIHEFKAKQKKAFDEEVKLWANYETNVDSSDEEAEDFLSHNKFSNGRTILAEFSGNVWQVSVKEGDRVRSGDTLLILEAMKMEFRVSAPCDGVVGSLKCKVGVLVRNGDPLVIIEQDDEAKISV